ncbi:hypothetical protein NDU88_001153 [Pleurodeles waltl]|uniref:Uncharacterized protein n=1 Tax=Pleurodeles waltl TaxID=8319 RepID=A0AAV7NEC0_PLEWA|nr:hypothetical protein NDU88_001153 [Pleurodeles waltl]
MQCETEPVELHSSSQKVSSDPTLSDTKLRRATHLPTRCLTESNTKRSRAPRGTRYSSQPKASPDTAQKEVE